MLDFLFKSFSREFKGLGVKDIRFDASDLRLVIDFDPKTPFIIDVGNRGILQGQFQLGVATGLARLGSDMNPLTGAFGQVRAYSTLFTRSAGIRATDANVKKCFHLFRALGATQKDIGLLIRMHQDAFHLQQSPFQLHDFAEPDMSVLLPDFLPMARFCVKMLREMTGIMEGLAKDSQGRMPGRREPRVEFPITSEEQRTRYLDSIHDLQRRLDELSGKLAEEPRKQFLPDNPLKAEMTELFMETAKICAPLEESVTTLLRRESYTDPALYRNTMKAQDDYKETLKANKVEMGNLASQANLLYSQQGKAYEMRFDIYEPVLWVAMSRLAMGREQER